MNIEVETITTTSGKAYIIRDIEKVRLALAVAEKAMQSIRDFGCGHKPRYASGRCEACDALAEWDGLTKCEVNHE